MNVAEKQINPDAGSLNLHELLPTHGDSMWVMNCGDHYEIRYYGVVGPALTLTADDTEALKNGEITFQ